MTALSSNPPRSAGVAAATATPAKRVRDIRLDFFRGIAMFIILIAHTPGNRWNLWIPARFGWSDATEIFVFCSGMASAIAFGKVFSTKGLGLGSLRVGFRIWQVYWAHVGLFVAVAATMWALNDTGLFERDYVGQLNLWHFFNDAGANLVGLMTLSYVPNYFDILPMYIVALALMPLMVALARIHPLAAMGAAGGIWLMAQLGYFSLSAEPWSDREWFFNPFGWQLIFFTGFAFMSGWLPKPPVTRWLIWLAVAVVILSGIYHFNWWRTFPHPEQNDLTMFQEWLYALHLETFYFRQDAQMFRAKTDFGLFRYVHFLALAYLAWVAAGDGGNAIRPRGDGPGARIWSVLLAAILKVGQQSLAIFVFSMWYARIQGVILDQIGRSVSTWALVNLTGFAMLIAVAYGVGWIKSHPWRSKPA